MDKTKRRLSTLADAKAWAVAELEAALSTEARPDIPAFAWCGTADERLDALIGNLKAEVNNRLPETPELLAVSPELNDIVLEDEDVEPPRTVAHLLATVIWQEVGKACRARARELGVALDGFGPE